MKLYSKVWQCFSFLNFNSFFVFKKTFEARLTTLKSTNDDLEAQIRVRQEQIDHAFESTVSYDEEGQSLGCKKIQKENGNIWNWSKFKSILPHLVGKIWFFNIISKLKILNIQKFHFWKKSKAWKFTKKLKTKIENVKLRQI